MKILPQRYPNQGVAAFIDFYDVRSAVDAKDAKIVYEGCELRTNFKTKSTERFDKYDHSSSRRDLDLYGKEPPYSGKRVASPSPPPEREKEAKEKNKDKEKSRGKERYSKGWLLVMFALVLPFSLESYGVRLLGHRKCASIRVREVGIV